ncbi:MAG: hypothetical protein RL375_1442 [Pseudomonadota bacterium]|jgi:hypothetical protein
MPIVAPPALPVADLETVYDTLAQAIDRTPPGKSELYLVKLALLMANELGSAQRVADLSDMALLDL